MGNLIKYEFRKSWAMKGIILVITAIFEVMFLIGVFMQKEGFLAIGVTLLSMIAVCSVFIIGIFGIFTLSRDLNTKRSYMLFMTPNNSFKILGAKLIENASSIIVVSVCFVALAIADVSILAATYGEFKELFEFINAILGESYYVDSYRFAMISAASVVNWISTVCLGFFAVIICATLLNGKKYNGFLSFCIFIAISICLSKLLGVFIDDGLDFNTTRVIIQIVYNAVVSVILYVASAWLMDNKLSV